MISESVVLGIIISVFDVMVATTFSSSKLLRHQDTDLIRDLVCYITLWKFSISLILLDEDIFD